MSMLVQYELFGTFGDATIEEISKVLGVGKQMARKHISVLELGHCGKTQEATGVVCFDGCL